MTNTISIGDAKALINYTIDNNNKLQANGKMPIAISLEASAGIGKTSLLQQIAQERGMTFAKISLHEMDEPGDLIGFPMKEFECQVYKRYKDNTGETKVKILPNTIWFNEQQLNNLGSNTKVVQTGKTRMGYAIPSWIPDYNENGTLVVLDDYVRANPQLLQSCMELILTQKYTSWSLPKKTTICLTNNPDDGNSNVNSLDEAQRTRFMNFTLTFSIDAWAKWAEENDIDGRCINFVLSYYNELFNADAEGNRICNPRSFTMFTNMISGIKDWDLPENLNFISMMAKGCFSNDDGKFSTMFTSFLRNKMHLIIQPKEILFGDWDTVKKVLEETMYDSDGSFRADISSLLERRFANYALAWLKTSDSPVSKLIKRIVDFIDNKEKGGKVLFTKDLFYHMIKTITSENKAKTNKLLTDAKIAAILL